MASIRDVAAYFCTRYPDKTVLSKARLTKLVYLADWKSAISRQAQITPITWYFRHYGPYVHDVIDAVKADPTFSVVETFNPYGAPKELIEYHGGEVWPSLSPDDLGILEFVIDRTATKNWNQFIQLVYSTYPILTQPREVPLDLIGLADQYKANRFLFAAAPATA